MKYTKEEVVELFEDVRDSVIIAPSLYERTYRLDKMLRDKGLMGLEVGKWYKVHRASFDCLFYFEGGDYSYGFWEDEWTKSISTYKDGSHRRIAKPATDEEVKQALIKEAEKRGFKEGVKCENLQQGFGDETLVTNDIYTGELSRHGLLWIKGSAFDTLIYDNGKWATIIDEPNKGISNMSPKCGAICDEPKELTVEQIQKELGYKIKIVE